MAYEAIALDRLSYERKKRDGRAGWNRTSLIRRMKTMHSHSATARFGLPGTSRTLATWNRKPVGTPGRGEKVRGGRKGRSRTGTDTSQ